MMRQLQEKLEIFTDRERMKTVLQQQLPEFSNGSLFIVNIKILYISYGGYLPKEFLDKALLSLCYELEVRDTLGQRHGKQMLHAAVFPEDYSHNVFEKTRTVKLSSPEFGEPLIHLADLNTIVWTFPNDPKLLNLSEVVDPEKVKAYLPYDLLPAGMDAPKDVMDIKVEVMRYKPESRCSVRYKLQWKLSDTLQTLTLFGKMFKDDRGKDIQSRQERLWKEFSEAQDAFMVAQPLGYNKLVKTLWQTGLRGVPLSSTLDRANYKDLLESVAKGLASLHKSNISTPCRITINDHLMGIRKKTAELAQASSRFRKPLQSIVRDLEKSALCLAPGQEKPIHGSFRINQVLVHEGKLSVFDFDNFALGDPAQDLADFIVSLYFKGIDLTLVNAMKMAFYDFYRSHIDWEVPLDRLEWHTMIQFIRRAFWHYRKQRSNLEVELQYIISKARKAITFELN